MKTVIFIKDIIKNFDMKSEFVRKICEYLKEVKFTSITSIVYYPNNSFEPLVSIGGCDSDGRCDYKQLKTLLSNHEFVVMPCIGGLTEWKVKHDLHDYEYNIIEIIPPRISGASANQIVNLMDLFAEGVADYIRSVIGEI